MARVPEVLLPLILPERSLQGAVMVNWYPLRAAVQGTDQEKGTGVFLASAKNTPVPFLTQSTLGQSLTLIGRDSRMLAEVARRLPKR